MFKIGDFSRLSQVSAKTLRFYDEMGLLKPAHVDEWTGYRYYGVQQLPRLNRILALKDLGLSLEQIAQLLEEGVPVAELRGMLRLKRSEIQHQMEEAQERLQRVEARLQQIEQEGALPAYEVLLKGVGAQRVLSIRDTIPTHYHVDQLFQELGTLLRAGRLRPTGLGIVVWHDREYREQEVDAEAVIQVEGKRQERGRAQVYDLPAVETMACVVHHGSFEASLAGYNALLQWIETNGYRIIGPSRNVVLNFDQKADPSTYVMECQFPVGKD